jgi:uncharacterized protein (DUF2164 family)
MGERGKKLLIFDVDGTLAPHGEPMEREVAEALCALERRGHTVGFSSGKTFEYLDGLARGVGLKRCAAIAENGAALFYGGSLRLLAERPPFFDALRRDIARLLPGVRLQHNMVNFTALATGAALEAVTAHIGSAGACDGRNCQLYVHRDAVDLLPLGVDKGRALAELGRQRRGRPADARRSRAVPRGGRRDRGRQALCGRADADGVSAGYVRLMGIKRMRDQSRIQLPPEKRREMVAAIKGYFLNERDEEMGELASGMLLNFIVDALAPEFYNQGVADAQKYISDRAEDLYALML